VPQSNLLDFYNLTTFIILCQVPIGTTYKQVWKITYLKLIQAQDYF